MSASTETWRPGDRILVRGGRWTVVERTPFHDCEALRLAPDDPASSAERTLLSPAAERTLLTPFDRPAPLRPPRSVAIRRPRRWLHAMRRAGARAHPVGGLTAAASGSIDLLPYQLEPALAMLRMGIARVMIADAVGLGKTIQAALILAELHARSPAFRALVIVPAGLREQWSTELATRFALDTIPADAGWLERVSRVLPPEVNPWILPGIYIASFDFLKRPEVLHPLESLDWDIMVLDEAHAASLGSARGAAVHAVAARARRVLLLTATPHAGDTDQFNALCRIGALGPGSPPLLLFQRTRGDAGRDASRRTVVLPVRLTETERHMHRLLDDYTRQVRREATARGDSRARLTAIVLKKRALSSAGSLAASARRRLALLAAGGDVPHEYQPRLPLHESEGDEDALEDAPPGEVLAAPGLQDAVRERQWLSAIAECAENAARGESKARLLLRLLGRMRQPAIVFTEFRDTLDRLQRTVASSGHDVKLLHGGVPVGERLALLREFRERGGILLATDAASEGLNLHHGCRAVIHYELPWSPARLEQRTGRVDRIGQARRVHEVLLVARDTAERFVLAPLARRAARARSAAACFGGLVDALSDSRVADAVMDGRPLDPDAEGTQSPAPDVACPPPAVLRGEAEAAVVRLGMQRTWLSRSGPQRSEIPIPTTIVRLRSSALPPAIVCIYAICLSTTAGAPVYRHVTCACEPAAATGPMRTAAHARSLASAFLAAREPAVQAVVLAALAADLAAAAATHRHALLRMRDRELAMAEALPSAARELVQAGLFDSRAVRGLEARRRSYDALLEASRARLGTLASDTELVKSVELTGILIAAGAPR